MNRLESAVRSVMLACNLTHISEVAARIGLQKSNLSKILVGDLGVSPTNLRKLVTGISSDPRHQFEILSAHLFDEVERSGFPLSLIKINFSHATDGNVTFADLPAGLQYQLRAIGDEIKDGDTDLGGTIRWVFDAIDTNRRWRAGETRVEPAEHFLGEEQRMAAEDPPIHGYNEPVKGDPTAPGQEA